MDPTCETCAMRIRAGRKRLCLRKAPPPPRINEKIHPASHQAVAGLLKHTVRGGSDWKLIVGWLKSLKQIEDSQRACRHYMPLLGRGK